MGESPGLITAIGAVSRNGMLGLDNWLPWDIPEELAFFERTVAGAALVIGRLTYESMVEVPPDAFIVSRQSDLPMKPGCRRVDNVEAALAGALATGKPVFVIGGASIYAAASRYCHRFRLTRIELDCPGDTRFPEEILQRGWRLLEERSETYLERRSGKPVCCRFQHHAQEQVLPLPASLAAE